MLVDGFYKTKRLIDTGVDDWVNEIYATLKDMERQDFYMLLVEIYPPTQGQLGRIWRKRVKRLARQRSVEPVTGDSE